MTPADLRAHVDTIVVVMTENRSFDPMLGHGRLHCLVL
jgi:phospholipase C